MGIVAIQPSVIRRFVLGKARLGMYSNPRTWERLLERLSIPVTWRVCNLCVAPHATTGHYNPDYSLTHDIYAVFEETGGAQLPLPAGFIQTGDAVLTCFEGVKASDQIYLPDRKRYYQVENTFPKYEPVKWGTSNISSFCYRKCNLTYLERYLED
jgi:hypothetical protein